MLFPWWKYFEEKQILFVMCDRAQDMWPEIEDFMLEFDNDPIHFGLDTVTKNKFMNDFNTKILMNFISLLFKQYIYR